MGQATLEIRNLNTSFFTRKGEVRAACFRERKVDLFRTAFPDGEIDDFYTDSVNDACLFPLAKRAFMVKGNEIRQVK